MCAQVHRGPRSTSDMNNVSHCSFHDEILNSFPFWKVSFFLLNLLGGGTGAEGRWEGMGKWVGSRYKMLNTYRINLKNKSSSTSLKQSLNWMQNPLILFQLTIFLLGSYIFSWMLGVQMGCNTRPRYMSNSSSGSCFLHDKLFNYCVTSPSLFFFFFFETWSYSVAQACLRVSYFWPL